MSKKEKLSRSLQSLLGGVIGIEGNAGQDVIIKLNPDFLKIDGSLIANLDTDKNAQIIVETIVDFSRKLGIQTVAEFVHSSTVLSMVKQLGIDFSQGYFIDRPSPQIPS